MTSKIESDYDTGWREGYEAASGAALATHDELRDEVERLRRRMGKWQADFETEARDSERLRHALLRLVELGEDDGSAPDDAWKSAFQNAADLLGRPKDG